MFSVLQINKYPLDFRIEKQKIDKKKISLSANLIYCNIIVYINIYI